MKASLDPNIWWRRAQKDLRSAQLNFDADAEGQAEVICYDCQQACEKMLKAFLLKNNWSLTKTHDLNYLSVEASQYLAEIRRFEASFYELNSLFMASHYPHDVQEPFSSADAEKALKLAQEVQQLLFEHFFSSNTTQN